MRTRIIATLAVGLLAIPALAGCSVIETTLEQVTGGEVTIGGNSVPADFPSVVPLPAGDVLNGSSLETDRKVWNVTIRVADGVTFESIAAELEAAGFTAREGIGTQNAEGATGSFNNGTYEVFVGLTGQSGVGTIANYTVTRL